MEYVLDGVVLEFGAPPDNDLVEVDTEYGTVLCHRIDENLWRGWRQ